MRSTCEIFEYDKLDENYISVATHLNKYGFIAIKNVPRFHRIYEVFLESARKFIALNDDIKAKYTPKNYYISGWSYGVENYKDHLDKYKGSYYAYFPNSKDNIWPQEEDFQKNYLNLANVIFKTGQKLLSIVNCYQENITGVTRMLHYSAVNEKDNDPNPDWCGLHRDHSLLTGLCAEVYYKKGKLVPKPKGAGLVIQDKEIDIDRDIMLFQVGEAAQLLTDGKLIATEHKVRKAPPDFERYTFVFFFNAAPDLKMFSHIKEYSDRFVQGMTYDEWLNAPFKKYKK